MTRALALRTFAALLCGALLAGASPRARADVVPAPVAPSATAPAAPAAPAATAAAPVPPAVIPPPEIVSRAEDAKILAKRIIDANAEDSVEREIERLLPESAAKLRERTARADALLESSPSFDALSDLDTEWNARMERFRAWRLSLTRSAKRVEADRSVLQAERELWQATRAAPETEALPQATRQRIDETLAMLESSERRLQAHRSRILTLQDQVASEELVINSVVDRVARQRDELGKRLLNRDAPPIWSSEAWAPSGDEGFVRERLRAALDRKADLIHEFFTLSISRLQIEATIFAVALAVLLVCRRRVTRSVTAQTDPALAVPTRVFARPVSAAIVVAIAWASWLVPHAPGALGDLEGLLLVIPVLRLLPAELLGRVRGPLIGLSVLFVAGSLRGLAAVPAVERLLILPELVGLSLVLYFALRAKNAERMRTIGVFGPVALAVARLGLVVCAAALVCNAIGLVILSRLLQRGVLTTVYAGVAIYALVRFGTGLATAALRSDTARRLRSVRDYGELMRERINTAQSWFGFAFWVVISLRVVGLELSARSTLTRLFQAKLELGTISLSLGNLLAFALTLYVAVQLSRFLRFVLDEDVLPHLSLPRGVPAAISTGLHYVILAAGTFIAIGAAGVDLSKFGLIAGALGVGIGFGLQNVVNNFVSGLILLFERPMQTGDTIEISGISGEVKRIGIRSSTLRTGDGADVIVPNASLISDKLVNWTFADRARRFDLEISVPRGSDVAKVIALLLDCARGRSEVLSLPAPVALFTRFSDSALVIQLQVWCRVEVGSQVRSELGVAVIDALRGAGIELAYPRQDVQLRFETSTE